MIRRFGPRSRKAAPLAVALVFLFLAGGVVFHGVLLSAWSREERSADFLATHVAQMRDELVRIHRGKVDDRALEQILNAQATASEEASGQARETGDLQSGIREYLSMLFWDPDRRDAFLRQFSAKGFRRHVNEALDADMARYDLNPEIAKFRLPVLVMTGRHDMNVAPLIAWKIHKAIPGSRLVIFERSGHLPFLEEPERFKQEVENFLAPR